MSLRLRFIADSVHLGAWLAPQVGVRKSLVQHVQAKNQILGYHTLEANSISAPSSSFQVCGAYG